MSARAPGSVAIEWMLADPSMRAIAIEARSDRAGRIRRNAAAFGVPGLEVIEGAAPAAFEGLAQPDAVFIGGGATMRARRRRAGAAVGRTVGRQRRHGRNRGAAAAAPGNARRRTQRALRSRAWSLWVAGKAGVRRCRSPNGFGRSHDRRGHRLSQGRVSGRHWRRDRARTRARRFGEPGSRPHCGARARKRDEQGVSAAAAALGVPLVLVSRADLQAAGARAQTRSERVLALMGVPSVAEAAALAASGPAARLIVPRISVGSRHLRPCRQQGANMTIHFIGAGPGAADLMTVRGRDLLGRCPVCLYAGSIDPAGVVELLCGRRPLGRHGLDDARRDRSRVRRGARGGTGRGAASFRRSLRVQRRRRTDPQARAARHSLHLDSRRAGFRRGCRSARPRAHRARGRPERHFDQGAGAGLADAGCRAAACVRRDRRDARAASGNSSHPQDRRRADPGLRRRLSRRGGGARDLAG